MADIRAAGLKPGIWFEPEVCGQDARAFQETNHLLKRHGAPITVGKRRFWDLCDPWVQTYLKERVLGLLVRYGFDYVKIDYNDSIGIGCDHPDGLGRGASAESACGERLSGWNNRSVTGHRAGKLLLRRASSGTFVSGHQPIIFVFGCA